MRSVDGERCYARVTEVPGPIDGVIVVTPPAVTEEIVRECTKKGVRRMWMQPGTESEEAIALCRDNNIAVVHDVCFLVQTKKA
jgi:predicted CoA-binding protein